MNTPLTAVMMCTFNGSLYVKEQIESILKQSWQNLHLYIRDDASTDSTRQILRQYEGHPKVTLYLEDVNLGYPLSFYDLLSKTKGADYYAFSDQDDVWFPDKISRAIHLLAGCDPQKPALVYAGFQVCDEALNVLYTSKGPSREPDFAYSLYSSSLGLGFTYVLNEAARVFITENPPVRFLTKDWWIGMCCTAFGTVRYDPEPCALHRRHADATTLPAKSFLELQLFRINRFLFHKEGCRWVHDVLNEFYDTFRDRLDGAPLQTLNFFLDIPRQPFRNIRKTLYPRRLRYDLFDEISLRLFFLLGLI